MNKGRNLLDNSDFINVHPEMDEVFNSVSAIYGDLIFYHRMNMKYTQKELSKKADISIKTIARAESGSHNLGIGSYQKIFNALNLNRRDIGEAIMKHAEDENVATIAQ